MSKRGQQVARTTAKYGSEWHFDVGDGAFGTGEDAAAVFRIEATKILAFARSRTLRRPSS